MDLSEFYCVYAMTGFFSRIRFRPKLLLMMSLALGGAIYFSSVDTYSRYQIYRSMGRLHRLTELSVKASALVHELQKERGMSAGYLGSRGVSFDEELKEQTEVTDEKRKILDASLKETIRENDFPEVTDKAKAILSQLENLDTIRKGVRSLELDASMAIGYYTNTNSLLLDLSILVASYSENARMTGELYSYVNFLKAKENAGIERAVMSNTFARDSFGPGMYERFISLLAAQDKYLELFQKTASDRTVQEYTRIMDSESTREVDRMRGIARDKGLEGGFQVSSVYWFQKMTEKINLLHQAETALVKRILDQASGLKRKALNNLVLNLILSALILLFSILSVVLISQNIASRTSRMLERIEHINEGDLRVRLDESGNDEITALEKSINQFVANLQSLVIEISDSSANVHRASSSLTESSNQLASEMEETSIQSGTISSASVEMDQNLTSIASSVEQSSITMGEMARNAARAAESSSRANQVASDATRVASELGHAAEEIGGVIETINGIADQTNLLSLNASIEAAGAGDAGRGFAVVAAEVKELAGQAQEATSDVKERIQVLQNRVEAIIKSADQIREAIQMASSESSSIASAVEEQSIAVKEMASQVSQAAQGSTEVARNIEGIAATAKRSASSTEHMALMARQLGELSEKMDGLVSRFTVS